MEKVDAIRKTRWNEVTEFSPRQGLIAVKTRIPSPAGDGEVFVIKVPPQIAEVLNQLPNGVPVYFTFREEGTNKKAILVQGKVYTF